jgi:hypothetical protein
VPSSTLKEKHSSSIDGGVPCRAHNKNGEGHLGLRRQSSVCRWPQKVELPRKEIIGLEGSRHHKLELAAPIRWNFPYLWPP